MDSSFLTLYGVIMRESAVSIMTRLSKEFLNSIWSMPEGDARCG